MDDFTRALTRLSSLIDNYFDERDDSPVRAELLDFLFEINHFLDIYERVDYNYVKYTNKKTISGCNSQISPYCRIVIRLANASFIL